MWVPTEQKHIWPIFVIPQSIDKYNGHDIDLHTLFIDFTQVQVHNVNRSKVYATLEEFEMPIRLGNLIMMTMEGTKPQV